MLTRKQAAENKRQLWRDINRHERMKAREKLKKLRAALREHRARRKQALVDAKERCRAERLAAMERARATRMRVLEELRQALQAERLAARQLCTVRLGEARAIKDDIARARAEWQAERQYQREMRQIERNNKMRRKAAPKVTRIERQGESDDEVRANIPAELLPLFEKVKRGIKDSPRMSRTEAFLRYAEEHPDEVLAVIDDKTEAIIRELEAEERRAAKSLREGRRVRARPPVHDAAADVPF